MNKSTVVLTTTEERQAMPGNSDKKPSKKKKQANNNQYQFLDELEIREANKNKENKKKSFSFAGMQVVGYIACQSLNRARFEKSAGSRVKLS